MEGLDCLLAGGDQNREQGLLLCVGPRFDLSRFPVYAAAETSGALASAKLRREPVQGYHVSFLSRGKYERGSERGTATAGTSERASEKSEGALAKTPREPRRARCRSEMAGEGEEGAGATDEAEPS